MSIARLGALAALAALAEPPPFTIRARGDWGDVLLSPGRYRSRANAVPQVQETCGPEEKSRAQGTEESPRNQPESKAMTMFRVHYDDGAALDADGSTDTLYRAMVDDGLLAGHAAGLPHGELVQPPRDYAIDDEQLPRAAQPMFTLAEKVLLVSLAAIGTALVTLGVNCIGG